MGDVVEYPEFLQAKVRQLVRVKKPSGVGEMVEELGDVCGHTWCSYRDIEDVWALTQMIEWLESL